MQRVSFGQWTWRNLRLPLLSHGALGRHGLKVPECGDLQIRGRWLRTEAEYPFFTYEEYTIHKTLKLRHMEYPWAIREHKSMQGIVHAKHTGLVLVLTGGNHRLLLELNLARFLGECTRVAAEDSAAGWI